MTLLYIIENMAWFCYILRCTDANHTNLTYNGFTNDPIKRLKNHHSKSQGATATRGKNWEMYALMTGFKTSQNALSCEWKIRHPTGSRKRPAKYCGVIGRIRGLNEILHLDKWTSKCTINNSDCEFTLYLNANFLPEINQEIVPPNINIVSVDKIDNAFLLDTFYSEITAKKAKEQLEKNIKKAQKEKDKLEQKENKKEEKLEKKLQTDKDKLEKKLQKEKDKLEKKLQKEKSKMEKNVNNIEEDDIVNIEDDIVDNIDEYVIVDNIEDDEN
jgi:predicted GIY-YIG superfamily endonuclease/Skp family chaperone for outer membrane proteins